MTSPLTPKDGRSLRAGLSSTTEPVPVSALRASIPNAAKRTIVDAREDPMNGNMVLWLSDGDAVCLRREDRELFRAAWWLDSMEIAGTGGRVDVIQYGRKVGELPDYWHPGLGQSSSPMYDFRRGDLVKRDGKWFAASNLGASDLDCLIGFVRKDGPAQGMETRQGGDANAASGEA